MHGSTILTKLDVPTDIHVACTFGKPRVILTILNVTFVNTLGNGILLLMSHNLHVNENVYKHLVQQQYCAILDH